MSMSATDLRRALAMITMGRDAFVPESLRAAAESTRETTHPWMRSKGVQGVGIGQVTTDGEVSDEMGIKVYVDEKKPLAELEHPVIPELGIEGLGNVRFDVEAIGRIRQEPNSTRVRPAIPGFSVGHAKASSGTSGCLVRGRSDKKLYILSNSHVLALEGTAKKGDWCLQPGPADGGTLKNDKIGRLADWIPFQFGLGFNNFADAAIAEVKPDDVTPSIRKIGVPIGPSSTIRRGMTVQKTGRTTDHTIGIIQDVDFMLTLNYLKPGGGRGPVGFRKQVLCTRYTAPGDSGSAVLSKTNRVVGLHFAGSASASIFSPIGPILDALHVDLVTR